ncbi:DinB family protein [Aquimarina sp. AU474]|uniref:DinB family protein n=1 Tax=Aquimarina sp. AU474 TaxID=2108529 RepID=UPI000D68D746|nr:DinB family protein [Aquimarina sp. AU474]
MNSTKIIVLNFSEIRRRSIKLWKSIPKEHYQWRPDKNAMSIIEMIRHVLETEHLYHVIIQRRGNLGAYQSPWEDLEYKDLQHELEFSETYRTSFIDMILSFTEENIENIVINRTEVNQKKQLGDYLMRTAYHESVHTGQLLDYLRSANIDRPIIWD